MNEEGECFQQCPDLIMKDRKVLLYRFGFAKRNTSPSDWICCN